MTLKFNSLPRKTLSQPITASATSFSLNDILDWNKEDLTSASFGTEAYGVFHDAKNTVVEFFAFDPSTIADSEIDFTYRGLALNGDNLTTEVAANKREWSKGTYVELGTHAPQIYQWLKEYVDSEISGVSAGTAPIATGVAGEDLLDGDIIYLKVADSKWWKADASTSATCEDVQLGVNQGAVSANDACTILLIGRATNLSGLSANTTYYISDTAGELSATAGTVSRIVGVGVSATELYFDPHYDNSLPGAHFVSTSSGASDEGKVAKLNASGQIPLGFLPIAYDTEYFTSSGTWTKPAGLKYVVVEVVGAGGGGGRGYRVSGSLTQGGGGGGGGYSRKKILASALGSTETVTVGAGGAGSSSGVATTGETSSFGSHASATGGSGGDNVASGSGGVGSGGDLNVGGCGGVAGGSDNPGGAGGSSVLGGGGKSMATTSDGEGGRNYGGGGGAGYRSSSDGSQTGGTGADGIVIVHEFF
jgi:hypothetical protein